MSLHKDGKLPQTGTKEWDALVEDYQAESGYDDYYADRFGYKNVDSFQRAMRKRGIKRVPDIDLSSMKYVGKICVGGDFYQWSATTPVNVGVTDKPLEEDDTEPSGINVPLKIDTSKEPKTVAFLFDPHAPFQDKKAVTLVREFLKERQPDYLVWGGDVCDFYQISTFDKNPNRVGSLQSDLDETRDMIWDFRIDLPNTKFYYLEGNHEFRLQKFLWTKAEALSSLRSLKLEELLTLKDYQTELIPYEKGLMINDVFLALHGDISSIHSGYTAKRLYEKHGGCGIAGHCHRQGSYLKRNRFGFYGWWEGGCLCTLEPDYIMHPNWTNGFALVTFIGKRFFTESIPIVEGKFIFGSKLYE